MIRMSIGLTRLPSLSHEEFLAYWRNHHAPLVLSVSEILGIRRYNRLVPLSESSGLKSSSESSFDGVAQVDFDSIEAVVYGQRSEHAPNALKRLREDEDRFIAREKSVTSWAEIESVL
jgi:uncharacterized protein (TIGR02118 family)